MCYTAKQNKTKNKKSDQKLDGLTLPTCVRLCSNKRVLNVLGSVTVEARTDTGMNVPGDMRITGE